ncbi:substrate-binding domain-containing protein [Pseudoalteromonas sp. SSDWG2]|uniref:substrate-binding domain-containing protein n=1 Tax=Pseudoalteromonas sp. SSDWG2 TaxID=3139391 RepID=UPI003BAB1256
MNTHHQPSWTQQLNELQSVVQNKYGIEIIAEKFNRNESYRTLVLSELTLLEDPVVNDIIAAIKKSHHTPTQSSTPSSAKGTISRSILVTGLLVTLVVFIASYFLLFTNQLQPIKESKQMAPQQPVSKVSERSAKAPLMQPKLAFHIHGSNTIGEKLAPALLQSYLEQKGATDLTWHQGDTSVERELFYKLDDKPYFIELHAHGSSTGFADILSGSADMAMSSRQVKAKEVEQLKHQFGDFSQVGNEHIIGLDGLAVIVNQNNPISHLTTAQLADVFSGKISNWQELGGKSGAINLYARDAKSGTWDTFKSLVLKKHQAQLSTSAQRYESSSELSEQVSQDELAIGFIGLNYILYNKAIAVSEGQQTAPIYPTRFTIGTEDYALSRRLYLYTPTTADMFVKDFAHFAISHSGQEIVSDTGLISQNIHVEKVIAPPLAPALYKQYAAQGQRLSLTFRFHFGSDQLDNKGKRDLQRLLAFLEDNPSKRVVLMGFSDNSGDMSKNQLLSNQRAVSVANELSARGISVFDTQGFGESLPVANNDSALGRERNRRVEVWVL